MISIDRLLHRKSDFIVNDWILDAATFSRIVDPKLIGKKGRRRGHLPTAKYAKLGMRWQRCGNLLAMVPQDYLCDSKSLESTGLTLQKHQSLTVFRYDRLNQELDKLVTAEDKKPYVMPVLQGYDAADYVRHIEIYGDRLTLGLWVGVGTLAKRSIAPKKIEAILFSIKQVRPDLRLHGFGVKRKSLSSGIVRGLLYSADSQAHSFRQKDDDWKWSDRKFSSANNPEAAQQYFENIQRQTRQLSVFEFL